MQEKTQYIDSIQLYRADGQYINVWGRWCSRCSRQSGREAASRLMQPERQRSVEKPIERGQSKQEARPNAVHLSERPSKRDLLSGARDPRETISGVLQHGVVKGGGWQLTSVNLPTTNDIWTLLKRQPGTRSGGSVCQWDRNDVAEGGMEEIARGPRESERRSVSVSALASRRPADLILSHLRVCARCLRSPPRL